MERFHEVHSIERKTSQRVFLVWGEIDKDSKRLPDQIMYEVWTKLGKAAQNREKQERAKETPELDNARRLRGIYFTDPDDEEYKANSQKREEKHGKTYGASHAVQKDNRASRKWLRSRNWDPRRIPKKVYGCVVDSHESTRQPAESSQSKNHEDFDVSLQVGAQAHLDATSDENSGCKSRSG